MKHNRLFFHFFAISFLMLLSGCRYQCWLEDVFNQGEHMHEYTAAARKYVRSQHVYDQLNTLAHFDAIWLSSEVRRSYAQLYAQKNCYTHERYQSFLRRQTEEGRHFISFYVLTAIRNQCGYNITDNDSEWGVCLCIDGNTYRPIERKQIDLSPEYILFFGKTYNKFKVPYLLKFDAQTIANRSLIYPGVRCIELIFTRADRQVVMQWKLDSKGCLICTDRVNKNVLAYDL